MAPDVLLPLLAIFSDNYVDLMPVLGYDQASSSSELSQSRPWSPVSTSGYLAPLSKT